MCQHHLVTNTPNATIDGAVVDAPEPLPPRGLVLVAGALGLILVSCLGGIVWGQRHPVVRVDETTCLALKSQIGCTLSDGWDISVSTDVPWVDAAGVFNESGRPECLPPVGRGASEPVLLDWIRTAAGARYVVKVTCTD